MNDREYDIAFLEIKIHNDELMREWLLHKLGRRAEVLLNAERTQTVQATNAEDFQTATNAEVWPAAGR